MFRNLTEILDKVKYNERSIASNNLLCHGTEYTIYDPFTLTNDMLGKNAKFMYLYNVLKINNPIVMIIETFHKSAKTARK